MNLDAAISHRAGGRLNLQAEHESGNCESMCDGKQMFSLAGKNALITGATRGIGLAIARGFLVSGAKVTICSRRRENVDAAVAQLEEFEDQLHGLPAHVGEAEDIHRLISAAETQHGPLDVLVNNAGTNPYFGPIVDSDEAAWDKTMDVNLKAPYLLSQLCAKQMIERKQGGSIINVASIAGISATPMQGIYSVSKAGLIMLTKVMARELGEHKIRVNCICPGLVKTRLSEALWSNPEMEQTIVRMKALGRMGKPDELVGAALYFASDASTFTSGAVMNVDGGMVL